MNLLKMNLNILTLTILLTINSLDTGLAQHSSSHHKSQPKNTRYHRLYDNSSTSTLSEASNTYYKRQNQTDDYYFDRYKKNKYSRNDDYHKNYNDLTDERNYTDRYEKSTDRNTRTENYFHIDGSGRTLWDGKHWDVTDFPLKIYVKESSSTYYKSIYKDYVNYAMNVWRKADDRINYQFVNSRRDADISLYFIENLGDKYDENYLGLTEYDIDRGKIIASSKIQISLIKFGDEIVRDGEIKATIIHELGHALGLGHSNNQFDIMYPYIDPDHKTDMNYNELSFGDKEAVKDAIDLGDKELYVKK